MIDTVRKILRVVFAIIGVLILAIGIWGEKSQTKARGRAIKGFAALHKTASEGIPTISPDEVSSDFDGRIVHLTGPLEIEPMIDDLTGSTVTAGALRRTVQMYQWNERIRSTSTTSRAGIVYEYDRIWSDRHIDSDDFNQRPIFGKSEEHINPPSMPYENAELAASGLRVGAWQLNQLYGFRAADDWQPVPNDILAAGMTSEDWETVDGYVSPRHQTYDVGAVRIAYEYLPVLAGDYSLLGIPRGGVLDDDISEHFVGPVFMLPGKVDAASIISIAEEQWFGPGPSKIGIAWIFIGLMLSLRYLAKPFKGLHKFTEAPFKRRLPITVGAAAVITAVLVLLV